MTAWLPSVADRPVGSSLLVAPPPSADQELTIRPWKVTALCLLPDDAMSFLTACAGRRNLAPSSMGADIAFGYRLCVLLVPWLPGSLLPGVKQNEVAMLLSGSRCYLEMIWKAWLL